MPLKRVLIFVILSIIGNTCYCQQEHDIADSAFFATMPASKISLSNDTTRKKGSLPFTGIKVIDARFDTSSAGYSQGPRYSIHKISFSNSASADIENYISKKYQLSNLPDTTKTLVMLLEKLWITASFEIGKKQKGDVPIVDRDAFGTDHKVKNADAPSINNAVIVKAKLFIGTNNSYRSLYQIDSFYLLTRRLAKNAENEIIQAGIDILLKKLANKVEGEFRIGKKVFNVDDIAAYKKEKISLPIIEAPGYSKGVFITFEEFKNNSPPISNYEILKTDKVDALYVKPPGESSYLLTNFWGYNDGKNIYVNKGNNFFRLFIISRYQKY